MASSEHAASDGRGGVELFFSPRVARVCVCVREAGDDPECCQHNEP